MTDVDLTLTADNVDRAAAGRWEALYKAELGEPMSRHGDELRYCCPFHADKTPSFDANSKTGLFHCFGCAAKGNAFQFLQRKHNISFPEAVTELTKLYCTPISYHNTQSTAATTPVSTNGKRKQSEPVSSVTVASYATRKQLPLEFLRGLGLHDCTDGFVIPYRDQTGQLVKLPAQRAGLLKTT